MDRCDKCGRGPLTLAPEPEGCHRLTRQIAESPPVALADRECDARAEIATLRADRERLTRDVESLCASQVVVIRDRDEYREASAGKSAALLRIAQAFGLESPSTLAVGYSPQQADALADAVIAQRCVRDDELTAVRYALDGRADADAPPLARRVVETVTARDRANKEIATLRARLDAAVERAASAFDLVALIGQTLGAEPGEAALSAAERVRARLDAARLDEAK